MITGAAGVRPLPRSFLNRAGVLLRERVAAHQGAGPIPAKTP
jgi:hypothetical protein